MTALRVDARVRELRREMGPVAWFVLEELAMAAVRDGAALVASTSVRELAATVSLNKDTVARAVAALASWGVVEHHQPASGGRFGAGWYVLTLPDGVALIDDTTAPSPTRPPRAPAATSQRCPQPAQLTLLGVDADHPTTTRDRGRSGPPQQPDALAPEVSRRPAARARDANVSGRTVARDGDGTPRRTVRPC